MTVIKFNRSGGAIGNDMHLNLDLSTLSDNDAKHLLQLLDEADFFNLPENLSIPPRPDEFRYEITVDTGDRVHTVHTSDSTIEKSLLPLIKELTLLKMLQ